MNSSERADDRAPEGGARGLLRLEEDVLVQEVGDEAVLLHLPSGTYYGLDPVGTVMLRRAREDERVEAVVDAVREGFDGAPDAAEIRAHYEALVEELVARGLVRRAEA